MRDWVTELLKKPIYLVAVLAVVVAVSFLAGSWSHSRKAPAPGAAGGRKILHYVDPMNPAHTSPEPGLAPCGMKMEPVYADDGGQAPSGLLPPGAVKINSQKQQLIGVRVAPVEKTPYTHTPPGPGQGGRRRDPHLPAQCLGGRLDPEDLQQLHRQRGQEGRDPGHLLQPRSSWRPNRPTSYALSSLDRFKSTRQRDSPDQIKQTRSASSSMWTACATWA